MKNRILIPTDFSENSWNALDYALNLFKEDKCIFYLLNAFQLYHFTTDSIILPEPGEPEYEKAREESEIGLEKLIDGVIMKSDNPNHHFEMISSYNSVLDAIKDAVNKKDISLIIMGTKGETNAANTIFGSNAENIMEKIQHCPVLVVPEDAVFLKEKKREIVFATDFKTYYSYRELQSLISIAKRIAAPVRILHILENEKLTPEQEENKESLREYLKEVLYTFHTLTNIKVGAGVHSFIESRGSEMLALIHKKHNILNSIFSKSLVHKVGYKPKVPILTMHELND
jgi:nucleotide-binding universal stress UspA family protein